MGNFTFTQFMKEKKELQVLKDECKNNGTIVFSWPSSVDLPTERSSIIL